MNMSDEQKKYQAGDPDFGGDNLPQDGSVHDSSDRNDLELDIEKKWLHLSRIDPEKFTFFYRKYYDPIFRFVFVEIMDQETAQDVTNEVFSEALDNLNRFSWQGCSFGAWLFRIAYHRRQRVLRKRSARDHEVWEAEQDGRVEPVRADDGVLDREERRLLQECLATLSEVRQQIFRAHYWAGLKVREIAIVTEMSEPAVKAHLQRGRRELLRCLLQRGLERGLSADKMKIVEGWTIRGEGWGLLQDDERDPGHD